MKIYFVLTLNKERVFIQILFCICLNYIKNVYSKNTFSLRLKYTVLLWYEFFISSWK